MTHEPLRFGDVRVDVGARQLWRGNREVHLTRKGFELLLLLVERRPNAVSKEEIHTRLWPDTFVSDVTLQSLVFEVREALADDARKPKFIRTVHGFGYAFNLANDPAPAVRRVKGWLVGERGRLPLFEGDNVLGREGDDVIDLASATVSRRHARISFEGDEPSLEDLGSKNGTFLEDRPVSARVPLANGNRIRLGSVLLTFRTGSARGSSTRTASSVRRVTTGE
jgi:hypothetical protein